MPKMLSKYRSNAPSIAYPKLVSLEEKYPDMQVDDKVGKFTLKVNVQDFRPEDVIVRVVGNKLEIQAERRELRGNSKGYSSFSASYLLPFGLTAEHQLEQSIRNGVLTITNASNGHSCSLGDRYRTNEVPHVPQLVDNSKPGLHSRFPGQGNKPPQCLDDPKPGLNSLCRARIPSYYYDTNKNRCVSFNYGGCGATSNKFKSKKECENLCMSRATSNGYRGMLR